MGRMAVFVVVFLELMVFGDGVAKGWVDSGSWDPAAEGDEDFEAIGLLRWTKESNWIHRFL